MNDTQRRLFAFRKIEKTKNKGLHDKEVEELYKLFVKYDIGFKNEVSSDEVDKIKILKKYNLEYTIKESSLLEDL